MVALTQLWLPILLAAILVFVASSLVHMVFKWHNSDYHKLPNEDEVRAAIRKGAPAPGQYIVPHCPDMKVMSQPEHQQKLIEGPVGFLSLAPNGPPRMGGSLLRWFLFNLLVAFFVAYLASRTVTPETSDYLHVFRIVGTATFLAYGLSGFPGAIWMGKPWSVVAKEVLDGLIYALVSAGAFGWLWPRG
ncbi:MAG TPA: hypothetical protein VMG41_05800 [Gemmatimonadales bacterium]|nr:hypothetical protein [Gemmatimonadales bacterium]